ncbi:MAG TPA: hypothetical protein PKD15_01925 [Candidatus Saccharibacteria bacterium]|jgi:hypothetical protein|nr:hypothetical protein [Candidatus Saccharibacteria bacterium]
MYLQEFSGERFQPFAPTAHNTVDTLRESSEIYPEQWLKTVVVQTDFDGRQPIARTTEIYPLAGSVASDTSIMRAVQHGRRHASGELHVVGEWGEDIIVHGSEEIGIKDRYISEIERRDFIGSQIKVCAQAVLRAPKGNDRDITKVQLTQTVPSLTDTDLSDDWELIVASSDPSESGRSGLFRGRPVATPGLAVLRDSIQLNAGGLVYEASQRQDVDETRKRIKENLILATLVTC